jgi:benzoyl-CoA-dihydrodiol lyase
VQRLRFEHPEVRCVVLDSKKDRIFCAGANIFMLGQSTHAFKVNFCKFTNETRLSLEDASQYSGQKYLAACNGTASGGGYELALACDEIILVDDRSRPSACPRCRCSASCPGTGGLTRVTDKRKVRRDLADHFCTLAEGVRGKRAVEWRLVDASYKLSQFPQKVTEHARALAETVTPATGLDAQGVALTPLTVTMDDVGSRTYRFVTLKLDHAARRAHITLRLPDAVGPTTREAVRAEGAAWWPLAAFREFDDALLHLRLNHLAIGTIVLRTEGDPAIALAIDEVLETLAADRFVSETRHFIRRTLKRLDYTSKTLIALGDKGSAFAGTLLEIALAADRFFLLDDPDGEVRVGLSRLNFGLYPDGQRPDAPRDAVPRHARPRRSRAGARRQAHLDARGGRPRTRDVHARRHRLGRRGPRLPRRAREHVARRADRHGGQSALRRPRDDGNPHLRPPVGLAELDLPTPERRR